MPDRERRSPASMTIEQMNTLTDLDNGAEIVVPSDSREKKKAVKISRADTAGNHYVEMDFTYHPDGGRHLYVQSVDDPTMILHVSRNGGVTECMGELGKRPWS